MKILHVIDSGGLYGAEIMLLALAAEQIKLGLDPTICSIGEHNIPEKPLETEAVNRGFKVKIFRMRSGFNLFGALKILQFAHSEYFNLIHSHGYKGNIFFGFIPKRIRKIPLVSTLHGWTNTGTLNRMKIYEWLDTKSLRFIDAVVVVNKAMFSTPKLKNKSTINLFTINNGIPPLNLNTHHHTLDKEIIDFCRDGFIVGAIGRLSTEKGFKYLIEAVSLLVEKGVDIKLVIIGEGNKRPELKLKIEELNLSDKVLIPGYRNSANQYLPFFDLFVLSSLTEGLPITLLEAMQSKIPIIATNVGGIPEVLVNGNAGILSPPSSTNSLAKGIYSLYKDGNLSKELAAKAWQIVMKEYTSSRMAQQYCDIYNKILNLN
ncbi:MAG: glycosyltransferase [Candidatus Scalindua sp.]|jgi:glycosyltransferase involved in cell wall biosynthesis|nr:glycosyltransferase [Candidatus Scalindua sp.]MBT6227965.1 glycosyltransferase [Candidatus Scalindua sp.]MBT6561719.1 glycosyltransferase [Candidatus Scalindua sp.]MBT7211121.1 glycosyltransferase [Candidatus Scalindua sp.]